MHEGMNEQSEADQALRLSEERFRKAFAYAAVGMALIDLRGRFVQVNPAYCAITGYAEQELRFLDNFSLTYAEDRPRTLELTDRMLAGITPGFVLEQRYVRKDGTLIWVQNSVSVIHDTQNEPHNILVLAEDITGRKQAQSALAISEARARRIFDANVVGVIHWNLDTGVIVNANDLFLDMVGYTREDLKRGRMNWRKMTPPDWRERNDAGVAEIRLRRHGAPYEKEYFRKNGSRVPILIGGALFDDSNKEGFSLVLDITERVQHQRQIEELNARLKRSIQETHHRVKNNLQVISALVDLQVEEEQDHIPVAAMTRIGHHTRSLAAIHDLLTQQAKSDPHTDALSSRVVMDRLISLLESTVGGRRIRHETDEVRLPVGVGTSLALLVSEIVSNAVKHGSSDIEVVLKAEAETICLEICDDGPGFPPDFDWQTAANTGLALIDSAARYDLRGSVAYDNRPQGGGRVTVRFPRATLHIETASKEGEK
jgi:PAS domain S-box-containing protein